MSLLVNTTPSFTLFLGHCYSDSNHYELVLSVLDLQVWKKMLFVSGFFKSVPCGVLWDDLSLCVCMCVCGNSLFKSQALGLLVVQWLSLPSSQCRGQVGTTCP